MSDFDDRSSAIARGTTATADKPRRAYTNLHLTPLMTKTRIGSADFEGTTPLVVLDAVPKPREFG